jgi:hypothetical protein
LKEPLIVQKIAHHSAPAFPAFDQSVTVALPPAEIWQRDSVVRDARPNRREHRAPSVGGPQPGYRWSVGAPRRRGELPLYSALPGATNRSGGNEAVVPAWRTDFQRKAVTAGAKPTSGSVRRRVCAWRTSDAATGCPHEVDARGRECVASPGASWLAGPCAVAVHSFSWSAGRQRSARSRADRLAGRAAQWRSDVALWMAWITYQFGALHRGSWFASSSHPPRTGAAARPGSRCWEEWAT